MVEAALPPGTGFIPNHCDLSPDSACMLLTGPNMAGKSTYPAAERAAGRPGPGRLAGPAESACALASSTGCSPASAPPMIWPAAARTFMVEMIETAAILHQAGPKSFVIVDEIGRGTGTRDGLAIAQAVLESLHNGNRCRAIFATHFHELFALAEALPRLKPHTMRVKEFRGEVVFMHEVVRGAAQRSWGVHVARLAGVPENVAKRAEILLKNAERHTPAAAPLPLFAHAAPEAKSGEHEALLAELEQLDPDLHEPARGFGGALCPRARLPDNLAAGAAE